MDSRPTSFSLLDVISRVLNSATDEQQVFFRGFRGDFKSPTFDLKGVGDDVQGAAIYSYDSNLTLSNYTFLKDTVSKEDPYGYDIYGLYAFYTIACKSHDMDELCNLDCKFCVIEALITFIFLLVTRPSLGGEGHYRWHTSHE